MKVIKKENGFTLIEVVGTLVITLIILLGFYSLLLSGAKSTKNADDMFNATYNAQKKMEDFYAKSKINKWDPAIIISSIPTSTFRTLPVYGDILAEYQYLDPSDNYYYTIRVKNYTTNSIPSTVNVNVSALTLTNIVIEIRKKENGPIKSKMENIIEWKGP